MLQLTILNSDPSRAVQKMNHTKGNTDSTIILIGMMGAGKTTIGKSLANHLDKTFIDSDHEIQKRTGVKIPIIFEIEGEAGFRKRETDMLRELLKIDNIVLATGGGIIINEENRKLIKEKGTIIYLRATVNDLLHRTRHDKNRPLLQTTDPQAKLTDLYDQRDPIYCEAAHIVVESGNLSVHQMVKYLTQKLDNLTLK